MDSDSQIALDTFYQNLRDASTFEGLLVFLGTANADNLGRLDADLFKFYSIVHSLPDSTEREEAREFVDDLRDITGMLSNQLASNGANIFKSSGMKYSNSMCYVQGVFDKNKLVKKFIYNFLGLKK
jgi:hypothetical protein